jgi:lysophospholipase L1-like esterase
MKNRILLCVIVIAACICGKGFAATVINDENGEWLIQSSGYNAKVNRKGYLSSIVVSGKEFLSQAKTLPGGSYLCSPQDNPVFTLAKENEASLSGKCETAEIQYEFLENRIAIQIKNLKAPKHFYIILNQAADTVNYMQNQADVPTITTTPAKAACVSTRWIQQGVSIDITGSDSIWGPWKEHQVWDASLSVGELRKIEIGTGLDLVAAAKTSGAAGAPEQTCEFSFEQATDPVQIPLCMIGDSITWAGQGDYWRKYLLENDSRFAFVGTHSAVLGYSHAGEGGNSTSGVLKRLPQIPACPYYSVLIGTNDTGIKDPGQMAERASAVADRITQIVSGLLKKQGVKKVFLCSILPCFTDNPLRDQTNAAVNVLLREKFAAKSFPEQVVWVELEIPIRAIEKWEPLIKLHPTPEGYQHIAKLHAEAMLASLGLQPENISPAPVAGSGVRVANLWDAASNTTSVPVIAGWYTVSFVVTDRGDNPGILIRNVNKDAKNQLSKSFSLSPSANGTRQTVELMTGYEGYGYTRDKLCIEVTGCKITDILFEKRRPSGKPSGYGTGVYIDTTTPPAVGELVEMK